MNDENIAADISKSASLTKRLTVLGALALALIVFFGLGGHKYLNLESLRTHQDALQTLVSKNLLLSLIGFTALYAVLVAISVPGAGFLSIFSGFLFGTLTGTMSVVIGATLGAAAVFLAARYVFGESLAAKAGAFMQKFEKGLKENELSYLFILRLVPIFPFFIVNIVPALFNVKFRNYVLTTFFGIIPGSLVYVSVGNGIGAALSAGEDVPLSGLMTRPAVLLPLLGLIGLSLIPIAYKKIRAAKAA